MISISIKVDGNKMRYLEGENLETANSDSAKQQIDEFGSHRFLRDPEMEPRQWATIQLLDIRMLQYAWFYGSQKMRRRWDGFIATLSEIEGPQQTPTGGALLV